jgi:toxin HigB-1
VIRSFADRRTLAVWQRRELKALDNKLADAVLRKLIVLDAAGSLDALRSPPGNRLERLSGDRKGQYSIRVNSQWRICFAWRDGHAFDVELVDYH